MTIKWHALPFTHLEADGSGCNKEATILEIAVSSDGCICVTGICIHCGEQFSSPEMPWATIMRGVTILDYKASNGSVIMASEPDLADMQIHGRPN